MVNWRKLSLVGLALILQMAIVYAALANEEYDDLVLMPWPQTLERGDGRLILSDTVDVRFTDYRSARLQNNANRLLEQWARAGNESSTRASRNKTLVEINVSREALSHESVLQSDESYQLSINAEGILLESAEPLGAIRGMQTLSQLLQVSEQGVRSLPYVQIDDHPRFKWRGVLLDSARHFIPLDVIKRQLDGMASAKMNVLHWHLTDDQGWRIESKSYPKLHELGSDGLYYRQDEIRELVAYAYDRGIRVIPEVDMPWACECHCGGLS